VSATTLSREITLCEPVTYLLRVDSMSTGSLFAAPRKFNFFVIFPVVIPHPPVFFMLPHLSIFFETVLAFSVDESPSFPFLPFIS